MNRKMFWVFIVMIFVACNNPSKQKRVKAKRTDITEYVYASAQVVPTNSYNSRPLISGIIKDIFVSEGDTVNKGQALFGIDATPDLRSRLKNAYVDLKEAKDNLSGENNRLLRLELELQQVREQNQIDSINYSRRKKLWDQKIGSKNVLEQSLLVYRSSKSRLATLQSEYRLTKATLENRYDKAEIKVNTERTLLDDLIIRSEIDGVVFSINKEVGDIISPQEIFAEIGSHDDYLIELSIDEVDISKVEIGDTAIILLEAYPDTVFASTLVYISMVKDEMTQTFKVESIFTDKPDKLFVGLAGEANIVIERRKNTLVIPSEYIIDGNKVLTEKGLVDIRIGVKSIDNVEILKGVDTSTVLLTPDM